MKVVITQTGYNITNQIKQEIQQSKQSSLIYNDTDESHPIKQTYQQRNIILMQKLLKNKKIEDKQSYCSPKPKYLQQKVNLKDIPLTQNQINQYKKFNLQHSLLNTENLNSNYRTQPQSPLNINKGHRKLNSGNFTQHNFFKNPQKDGQKNSNFKKQFQNLKKLECSQEIVYKDSENNGQFNSTLYKPTTSMLKHQNFHSQSAIYKPKIQQPIQKILDTSLLSPENSLFLQTVSSFNNKNKLKYSQQNFFQNMSPVSNEKNFNNCQLDSVEKNNLQNQNNQNNNKVNQILKKLQNYRSDSSSFSQHELKDYYSKIMVDASVLSTRNLSKYKGKMASVSEGQINNFIINQQQIKESKLEKQIISRNQFIQLQQQIKNKLNRIEYDKSGYNPQFLKLKQNGQFIQSVAEQNQNVNERFKQKIQEQHYKNKAKFWRKFNFPKNSKKQPTEIDIKEVQFYERQDEIFMEGALLKPFQEENNKRQTNTKPEFKQKNSNVV